MRTVKKILSLSVKVNTPKGVHALWLHFNGAGDMLKVSEFKFGK